MGLPEQHSDNGSLNRRTYIKLAGGSAAAAGGLAGCLGSITGGGGSGSNNAGGSGGGGSSDGSSGGSSSGSDATWKKDLGTDFQFWMVTNEIVGEDHFFPSTYFVTEGSKVGIHLKNTDSDKHDLTIDAFGISADHEPGATDNITFTADKVGVHEIICDVHPPWMRGQLVVLPKSGGSIPTSDSGREFYTTMGAAAKRDSYMPATYAVVEGEDVTMHVENTDSEKHDLTIDAFDISADHKAGATDTIHFTADKVGLHQIMCDIHPPWMKGQLLVLPKDGDWSKIEGKGTRDLWMVASDIADRDSFFPAANVAKQGESVNIHLKNTDPDGAKHDLTIDAYGVEGDHEGGTTDVINFSADKAGINRMYCDLHPPAMAGQLLVIPKEKGEVPVRGYDDIKFS